MWQSRSQEITIEGVTNCDNTEDTIEKHPSVHQLGLKPIEMLYVAKGHIISDNLDSCIP